MTVECELKFRCYAPQACENLCRNIEFVMMSITWMCEPQLISRGEISLSEESATVWARLSNL